MKKLCMNCFKNLGVSSRIKIYAFLSSGDEKNVTQITDYIGLKQPTISYHLHAMLKSGLLSKKPSGKEIYYHINENCPHDGDTCVVVKRKG